MDQLPHESLSEIQERYRSLVENLQIGIYRNTPGPKGHFLEANPAIIAMFEAKSKAEFMKHNVSDLYQNPNERQEFVKEILKKGQVKNKEINLITLKGKKIVGSVTAVMKKDKDGKIFFDGIIENITKHKKTEDELYEYRKDLETRVKSRTQELENTKEAMLNVMEDLEKAKGIIEVKNAKDEAMLASIGEGIVAVDNLGKVMIMNKVAENMLGWKTKEMLGKKITDLKLENEDGTFIPFNRRPTTRALSTGATIKVTYFFVRKDNTRFPMAITATPIKLNKKAIGLIEIIRDVTEELEIDKAKSEFVSLASHQLRTPLGIIKWYLEALNEEAYIKNAPDNVQKYFNEIFKSNERVLSLVRDLLSVSRIDQGHVKNIPKLTDVTKMVKNIADQMKILARKDDIALTLDIKNKEIPLINIDSLRLHEVIENLVTNAIVYSNPKGIVKITIDQKDDNIILSVEDHGVGISKKDQVKLFTKFFRSQNAITKNTEGSGLGLYVVKSYIDVWGGKITVKSTEGKGSTFSIRLPIKMKEGEINK
ncbi:MAG TPA: ATP-binding protein [Patescibacteria group bacterium]|nr:ATP-binding protein [Patescibacteria group bacterium]